MGTFDRSLITESSVMRLLEDSIYDAWFLICVLSNANFNVPYLSLGK